MSLYMRKNCFEPEILETTVLYRISKVPSYHTGKWKSTGAGCNALVQTKLRTGVRLLEDHWSCSSPERLSHCKLMRFKLIKNRPMKVYAWTLLTPGAWPNLTQGHAWHNL